MEFLAQLAVLLEVYRAIAQVHFNVQLKYCLINDSDIHWLTQD